MKAIIALLMGLWLMTGCSEFQKNGDNNKVSRRQAADNPRVLSY